MFSVGGIIFPQISASMISMGLSALYLSVSKRCLVFFEIMQDSHRRSSLIFDNQRDTASQSLDNFSTSFCSVTQKFLLLELKGDHFHFFLSFYDDDTILVLSTGSIFTDVLSNTTTPLLFLEISLTFFRITLASSRVLILFAATQSPFLTTLKLIGFIFLKYIKQLPSSSDFYLQ